MLIPDRVGVMILGEATLFPQAMLPLFIFEPRYRAMLSDSLESHRLFCLAVQRVESARESPCRVATLGMVRACVRTEAGTSNLVLQVIVRVRLGKIVQTLPYRKHLITPLPLTKVPDYLLKLQVKRILKLVGARLRQEQPVPLELIYQLASGRSHEGVVTVADCVRELGRMDNPGHFADLVANLLLPGSLTRKLILQATDEEERLTHLEVFLREEVKRGDQGSNAP